MQENEYFSVTEYAKLTGKDPRNIRRMAISGRLPAIKVGSQWCIHKDTPYPADNRVRTGKYIKAKE